jgi:anti-sigma factor RsiW
MSHELNCEQVMADAVLFVHGELPMEQEERIESHLTGCAGCRREVAEHRALFALVTESREEVPPSLLVECRRNLSESLGRERVARQSWLGRLSAFFAADAWIWKPVAALAVFAAGFEGSKLHTQWQDSQRTEAARNMEVRSVRAVGDGQIELVYDLAERKSVKGRPDDEAIRGLLVRTARESSDAAVRAQTVALLERQTEAAEVRDALMGLAKKDPNAQVRSKAVEGLRALAGELGTRRVLVEVIRTDDNAQVRARAVDMLTLHTAPGRFDTDMVGALQETLRRESDGYVRQRCQKVLLEAKASPDIF